LRSLLLFLSKVTLQTDASPWFIPLCLIAGFSYGFILYSKKSPWSRSINYALLILRAAAVALICFFLLGPLLNQVTYLEEKPIVVVAIDDSASIKDAYDSTDFTSIRNQIESLFNILNQSDYDVRLRGLNGYLGGIEELSFSAESTNLHGVLQGIRQDFEQQNLTATVLVSDGIHNYGSSPQFLTLNYPVFSLALGDTIPEQDLSIKRLNYNKIAYQGNRFPLEVDLYNNGYVGEEVFVDVLRNEQVVESKSVTIRGDQEINTVSFLLDAETLGIESYRVSVRPKANESSVSNNSRTAFIEVVDSEQRILIAAAAPHPDIKALRAVIESKEGVEVDVFIEGIAQETPEGPYDLIVLHQLPQITDMPNWLSAWISQTNTFYITGVEDLNTVNALNPVLAYNNFGQSDAVSPNFNPNFELFNINQELLYRAGNYPPVRAPYGNFEIKANASVYLYQKVGSAQTSRPLLTVLNGDDTKSAVFSGAGFWKWRLQENGQFEESKLFDELFGKLIQFLATKDDKRNFRINTTQESYFNTEVIEFNTEVYNQLYEKVYDYSIDLQLTNAAGETEEYNFVNSPTENFKIRGLEPGVYRYTANTSLAGKRETAEGTFSVQALQLEDIDLTANHQLLRNIAKNSGGRFYLLANYEDALRQIDELDARPISRANEKLNPIINNPWWLYLLLALFSLEWFTRKYHGSY